MDDLISRQWLMECVDEGWIKFDTEKDKNQYIHLVRDIAPSAQRWIPCTPETMPKVREWVLCQCRAGIMDVLRLTEDGSWNKNYPHAEYMSGFVIAWMPLPALYRPEGDRDNVHKPD